MEKQIEAILFYKNEPVSLIELGKILDTTESEIREGLNELKINLQGRGVRLLENQGEYALVTSAETSEIINKLAKEEISRDLGKAGLETLSIILYKGPISRREIDYVRGVNSTFILRSLVIRGLVEKTTGGNKEDGRVFLYKPTLELLSLLGIESLEKLPEFGSIKGDLDAILNSNNDGQV